MKCTDKEWQYCRVEKMGCKGCYYHEPIIHTDFNTGFDNKKWQEVTRKENYEVESD